MPQLDVYRQQQTAQNELRVVRNAQPSAAAAEVVGETITAFGELGMRIQEARAEQEAANLEIEAKRRYDAAYRELEADPDAEDQFESRLMEKSREIQNELLGKVKSKPVRDAFDLRLKGIESAYVLDGRDLSRKRTIENIKAGVIGRIASLEDTAKDMSVAFEDKDRPDRRSFANERDVIVAEINSMAKGGWIGKDEAAEFKVRIDTLAKKADSDRILNEIDNRLDAGESAAAEEYFKLNYGRILPEAREAAESALESKTLESRAITKADEFWAKSGGDYGAALNDAYGIQNPEERLAVEARLAQLKNQFDAAVAASDQAHLEKGMDYVTRGEAIPADLLRQASPLVRDRLQTEVRTRRLWEQQMATLSAEEKAALKEASNISKDYFKSLSAVDPELYLGGPSTWTPEMLADWDQLQPEHKSDVLSDIATKRAAGGTFDASDKVLKDVIAQVPMLGPSNMKAKDFQGESKSKGAALKEEQAVRASLYRQAQEYAKRTGGAPITPQESKIMIARAFREANSARYPFEEPGAFMNRIAGAVASSPVYQTSRAYLKEKLGREPTDQEVMATMRALGEAQ